MNFNVWDKQALSLSDKNTWDGPNKSPRHLPEALLEAAPGRGHGFFSCFVSFGICIYGSGDLAQFVQANFGLTKRPGAYALGNFKFMDEDFGAEMSKKKLFKSISNDTPTAWLLKSCSIFLLMLVQFRRLMIKRHDTAMLDG